MDVKNHADRRVASDNRKGLIVFSVRMQRAPGTDAFDCAHFDWDVSSTDRFRYCLKYNSHGAWPARHILGVNLGYAFTTPFRLLTGAPPEL